VEEEVIGRNPALRLHKSTDARHVVVVTFAHAHAQVPAPVATAGGASHVIAGPWVFPLLVG
jgi:hypothetical protein